ncbi:MAG: amidohydrolase [Rhodospirillales bacterium]|nr:amidohydrolase [Rhodospirillales bacterium]
MIVDVHAHYTQASAKLDAYRGRQISSLNKPSKGSLGISDDEIIASLQGNIRQMKDRGIDRLMFSPRAGGMGHEFGNALTSRYWTEVNNDLIGRVCRLLPAQFSPVGQLPQSPGISPENCAEEIERCVAEWGFVGFNINPDVSGGAQPFTPSLGDEWWYPLWERMVALDLVGMIHASATLNPAQHMNGAHYVNWDTAAVIELCNSRVFDDFPGLKLIVPHGGGAIPFQWRRHSALHALEKRRPFEEMVKHLYFDLALYDRDSMELAIRRMGPDNLLYASEMFGTAKAVDPTTGRCYDDTVPFLKEIDWLSEADKEKIFSGNARRLYSRVTQW